MTAVFVLSGTSNCGTPPSTRERLGGVPDRLRSTGHDAHLHLHAEMVRRKSDKGTVKRDRMARIWDNCDDDKVDVADAAASARKKRCAEARPTWRKRSR
jgi:hypothetical protein